MEQQQEVASAAGGQSRSTDGLGGVAPAAWMYKNAYTENWYLRWEEAKDRLSVPLYTPEQIAEIVASERRHQKLMEENNNILRREIAEMQELCDDLSSSVIAAAFLAPHGNGAKALLDEAVERMATRARRKVGGSEAVK